MGRGLVGAGEEGDPPSRSGGRVAHEAKQRPLRASRCPAAGIGIGNRFDAGLFNGWQITKKISAQKKQKIN